MRGSGKSKRARNYDNLEICERSNRYLMAQYQSTSKNSDIPLHIGIILDGNRRWAKKNGLPTLQGHKKGAEVFKEISLHAFDLGVKYLSAYVFSTENWSRTEAEVAYLMKLVVKSVEGYLKEYNEHGVRIVIAGSRSKFSPAVLKSIKKTEESTKNNKEATLVLCFNYGGQQEIADATAKIIEQGYNPDQITPELVAQNLYAPDVPDVDLIIRTSGEQRLSGFMLWRSAYAELLFVDKLWPDYRAEDLENSIKEYINRQRRFGQ